jgi:hypothetical protein
MENKLTWSAFIHSCVIFRGREIDLQYFEGQLENPALLRVGINYGLKKLDQIKVDVSN